MPLLNWSILYNAIRSAIDPIYNWISNKFSQLTGVLGDIIKPALDWLRDKSERVEGLLKDTYTDLTNWSKEQASKLEGYRDKIVADIKSHFSQRADTIEKYNEEMRAAIKKDTEQGVQRAWDIYQEASAEITKAVSRIGKEAYLIIEPIIKPPLEMMSGFLGDIKELLIDVATGLGELPETLKGIFTIDPKDIAKKSSQLYDIMMSQQDLWKKKRPPK